MAIERSEGMFSRWQSWLRERARASGGRTRRVQRRDPGSAKPTARSYRRGTIEPRRTIQGTRRRGGYTNPKARKKRSKASTVGASRRTHNPGRRPARTVRK